MTREQMIKTRWRPYMEIIWRPYRSEEKYCCLLVSINFDEEILILQPVDDRLHREDFHVNLKNIELKPKDKFRVINQKTNPERVNKDEQK